MPANDTSNAIVSLDGTGQYTAVQDAVNATPITASREKPWTVLIRPGTYRERIYVQREKRFVRLVGEEASKVVITFDAKAGDHGPDDKPIGTFRTPTAQIDADDFEVVGITFENSAGQNGQALALRVDGDRVVFRECAFKGYQDTIFLNRGRQYFDHCRILGAVDFIFGGATAWFENCDIECTADGYITAPSTPIEQAFGFVFSHCRITGQGENLKTFLGRPWRQHGAATYLHCDMTDVIRPEGWNNWRDPDREKTARFAEFASTGAGGKSNPRAPWAKQLTQEEATKITPAVVFGDWTID
jgi:pectinesterase